MRSATDVREDLQSALGPAFRVEQELGGGGMSRVFVARDVALDRPVVVKLLPPEYGSGSGAEAFRREIQVAARLQHPHIVPILAAGEMRGSPYYTMPFVDGESLRVRLSRHSRTSIAEVLRILHDVIDALAYAHSRGVVHRDIKPDNVLMSGSHAMITDFGVAKALCAASSCVADGEAGFAIGTPAYMAPEQAAADPHTDHRADLYAFGVLAYELLANRPPFSGRSALSVMAAQVTERPAPIDELRYDVPPTLAGIIMTCLEKNPDERPASAARIREMLESIAFANASLLMPRAPRTVWHHGSRIAAAIIAFVAGITGLSLLGGADRAASTFALTPVAASAPTHFAMQASGGTRTAHQVARAHASDEEDPRAASEPRSPYGGPIVPPPDDAPRTPASGGARPPIAPVTPTPAPAVAPSRAAPERPAKIGAVSRIRAVPPPAEPPRSVGVFGVDTALVLRELRVAIASVRDSVLLYVRPGAATVGPRPAAGAADEECPERARVPKPATPPAAAAGVASAAQRLRVTDGTEVARELSRLRVDGNAFSLELQHLAEQRRAAERMRAADLAELERLMH